MTQQLIGALVMLAGMLLGAAIAWKISVRRANDVLAATVTGSSRELAAVMSAHLEQVSALDATIAQREADQAMLGLELNRVRDEMTAVIKTAAVEKANHESELQLRRVEAQTLDGEVKLLSQANATLAVEKKRETDKVAELQLELTTQTEKANRVESLTNELAQNKVSFFNALTELTASQTTLLAELASLRGQHVAAMASLNEMATQILHTESARESALAEVNKIRFERDSIREAEAPLAQAIALGPDFASTAIKIAPLDDPARFDVGTPVDLKLGVGSRVNAALQAIPQLLVANVHHGRQLMEVVINGELVRAASGDGFRAWAVGATGRISEQATLFSADNLLSVVNGAAIWSLASIVLAQKHLADISEKLADLGAKLDRVSAFLSGERRARIKGTHDYLCQAESAIRRGELPDAIRHQLEASERDLVSVQFHLVDEFHARARTAVEHSDMAGTAEFQKNMIGLFRELDETAGDLELCIQTRVLAWFVLSLYPAEPQLKLARREAIEKSILAFDRLRSFVDTRLKEDLPRFKSYFNREQTIRKRVEEIQTAADSTKDRLLSTGERSTASIQGLARQLNQADSWARLAVEVEDGKVIGARSLLPS